MSMNNVSQGAIPAGKRPRRFRAGGERINWVAYLFVLPYVVFFAAMVAYPLGYAIYLGFHEWSVIDPAKPFVGLDNFERLFNDNLFWKSLRNTVKFLLVNVPVTVVVSLLLAVALNRPIRGRTFFRASFFLPYVTAGVVVSLIWQWMLGSDVGIVARLFKALGLPEVGWLTDPSWTMVTIALMVAWKQMGVYVILYLGGLQGIPTSLYEAAQLDGANAFQRFWTITIPQLRPITMLVVLLSTIVGFQLFTEPYIMTGGGPLNSSISVVLYIYRVAFERLEFGYASAIGMVLALFIMLTVLAQRLLLKEDTGR